MIRKNRQALPLRRQRKLFWNALGAVTFVFLFLNGSRIVSMTENERENSTYRKKIAVDTAWMRPMIDNERNNTSMTGDCVFRNLSSLPAAAVITPIWVPSYPGSGSNLFADLIQATTGGEAANYYKGQCTGNPAIVTCKTHWPSIRPFRRVQPSTKKDVFHNRSMFLIRNPRKAIPSFVNVKWEMRNKIHHHTRQAPESFWRRARDDTLTELIKTWENMISEWQLQPFEIVLYVQYEKLTDRTTGPELLQSVINEVKKVLPASVDLPNEDLPCLWHKVVKGGESSSKREDHKYKPKYTVKQKQQLLEMLDRVILKFSDDNSKRVTTSSAALTLLEILHSYREDIAINTPLEEN